MKKKKQLSRRSCLDGSYGGENSCMVLFLIHGGIVFKKIFKQVFLWYDNYLGASESGDLDDARM